jgi:hypothetical protein
VVVRFTAVAVLSLLLAVPAIAATDNWTGTTSGQWTVGSNWGGTAPVAGDDLNFANLANANALNNGYAANTAFNSLTFNAAGMFTPSGNVINLGAGGITQTSGTTLNDFIAFTLTASQTWTVATPGQLILNGPATLALGANNLTISGDGSHAFSGNTVTGTGTITLLGTTAQTLTVTGNLNSTGAINIGTNATLNLSTPAAIATPIVVNSGGTLTDAIGFSGFMNAPLTIGAGGTYAVTINGTAVLQYSRVTVNTAPITLAGNLVVTNNTPAVAGTVYSIITNQTGSPIVGTFAGLPEGATFTAGGQTFKISYAHDVTITVQGTPTTTTLQSSLNPSVSGQSVTFTATVSPTATGNVTFFDASTPLGTIALNGSSQAAFTTSSLSLGSHHITAQYAGNTSTAGSTSSILIQQVLLNTAIPTLDGRALALLAALLVAIAAIHLKR